MSTGLPASEIEGKRLTVPFNIAAYVEETEQAGPFLKLMMEVFARNKADLESKLSEIIGSAVEQK